MWIEFVEMQASSKLQSEGRMKLARRFNGGKGNATTRVPGRGRLNICNASPEKAF
jgi:hypothetical protein